MNEILARTIQIILEHWETSRVIAIDLLWVVVFVSLVALAYTLDILLGSDKND